jgi:hypothetical protein
MRCITAIASLLLAGILSLIAPTPIPAQSDDAVDSERCFRKCPVEAADAA